MPDPIHLYAPLKVDAYTNARGAWYTLEKRKNREKQTTAWLLRSRVLPDLPVVVTFTRISPRDLDDDNLPSAFKYVRDTIAAHYGTHDGTSAPITWRYQQRRARVDEVARYGFTIDFLRPDPGEEGHDERSAASDVINDMIRHADTIAQAIAASRKDKDT